MYVAADHDHDGEDDDDDDDDEPHQGEDFDPLTHLTQLLAGRNMRMGSSSRSRFAACLAASLSRVGSVSYSWCHPLDDRYLRGITSEDDMVKQSALEELAQTLLMGNEETLAGFSPRAVVPALV